MSVSLSEWLGILWKILKWLGVQCRRLKKPYFCQPRRLPTCIFSPLTPMMIISIHDANSHLLLQYPQLLRTRCRLAYHAPALAEICRALLSASHAEILQYSTNPFLPANTCITSIVWKLTAIGSYLNRLHGACELSFLPRNSNLITSDSWILSALSWIRSGIL